MRKHLLFLLLLMQSMLLFSQNIIITVDAEEISGKVLNISPSTVSYQKEGQTVKRTIDVEKVFMIKYANGEKETFSSLRSQSGSRQDLPLTTELESLPRASRPYRLLDLYDENGVKGIVIETHDEGYHGKIISLDEKKLAFMKGAGLLAKTRFGLVDQYNGLNNQTILLQFIGKSVMITLNNFPAIQWCTNHGKGWYLPAKEEIEQFFWTVSQGKGYTFQELNEAIENNGGDKVSFSFTSCYLSSTETDSSGKYIPMASKCFYVKDEYSIWEQNTLGRYAKGNVRAMYRF